MQEVMMMLFSPFSLFSPLTLSLNQGIILLTQLQFIRSNVGAAFANSMRRTQVGNAGTQNIITGNLLAVTTGAQTSSPTNVG